MSPYEKSNTLNIAKPTLAEQWQPTMNGTLSPKDVLLKYREILSKWNTIGLEIRLDNGTVVQGINVRIVPGYRSARISADLPSIGPVDYILYSNGELKSYDGLFKYKCK